MSTHHTQPLRVWEILDHAVALYRHCFQMLMRVAALVLIPAQIICTAFIWAMIAWGRSQTQHSDRVTIIVIGLAIGFIGVFLAGLLVLGADVKIASEGYLERAPVSAREALRIGRGRVLALVGLDVLLTLGMLGGFILLIIPGIWLIVAWLVAPQALLLEDVSPARALGRSRRLVKGHWWRIAGVLLIIGVCGGIANQAVSSLLRALFVHGGKLPWQGYLASASIGEVVSGMLVIPLYVCAQTVAFYDLRMRWDASHGAAVATHITTVYGEGNDLPSDSGQRQWGPDDVGRPGGPPYWPPPPGWRPGS